MQPIVLSIENLSIEFPFRERYLSAVDHISFMLRKSERLGIVGESGCGKSVTCKSILRLLPPSTRVSGDIRYGDRNILAMPQKEIRRIRGREISMIFQEPTASLDPLFTVGDQLMETLCLHRGMNKKEAREQAVEMLNLVSIPQPEQRMRQYPFEFSGGMCQRVMIAMALSCHPGILIADEPTTALDVTIQAQIIDLMRRLNEETHTAIILITHDLGVIAETVERVLVMYAGHIVESADVRELFHSPRHPYTQGLLQSIPRIEVDTQTLRSVPGSVPSLHQMPIGCRFSTRCAEKRVLCEEQEPPMVQLEGAAVKCWMYTERW